jgi:hypothetical protein
MGKGMKAWLVLSSASVVAGRAEAGPGRAPGAVSGKV